MTAQVREQLDQTFEALRLSLAVGIQHGLSIVLVFCAAAFLVALFLKDRPMG